MAHPFSIDPSSPRTASGNITLTADEIANYTVFTIDPAGARDLTLPDASATNAGTILLIQNTADAAEVITIKANSATVCTPTQAEAAVVWSDGTKWRGGTVTSS